MFETVDVLVHAIDPIPVGQEGHGRLQRHRPRTVTGYQLVDQGEHVLVQRERTVGFLHGLGQRHHGAFPARQDLLAERAPVLVRSHVGHVGHGERVQIVAFAGGDDLPAGNGPRDGLPFALPVRLDDDVASETDLSHGYRLRAIAFALAAQAAEEQVGTGGHVRVVRTPAVELEQFAGKRVDADRRTRDQLRAGTGHESGEHSRPSRAGLMPWDQGTFVEIAGDHVQRARGTQREHAFLVTLPRLVQALRLADLLRHHRIQASASRFDRAAVGTRIPVFRHTHRPAGAVTHAHEPVKFGNGQSGRRGNETHHADATPRGTAEPVPIVLQHRHERIGPIAVRFHAICFRTVVFVFIVDGHSHLF